jgi:hypothetical protein
MNPALRWFDDHWARCQPWLTALWISRASVASVFLGLVLFAWTGAVHDMIRTIAQDIPQIVTNTGFHGERLVAFLGWSFFWAATVHYTARVLLWMDFGLLPNVPAERDAYRRAFKDLPRWLGVAAIGTVAAGVLETLFSLRDMPAPYERSSLWVLTAALVVEGACFMFYAKYRIDALKWTLVPVARQLANSVALIVRQMHGRSVDSFGGSSQSSIINRDQRSAGRIVQLLHWIRVKKPEEGEAEDVQPLFIANAVRNYGRDVATISITDATAEHWTRLLVTLVVILVLGFGSMLFALLAPLGMAHAATQSGVLFLILATWLPFFSIMVFLDQWRCFPTPLLLFLAMIALQVVTPWDNHTLRLITDPAKQERSVRPDLVTALRRWAASNGLKSDSPPVPLVIVATAGGGSRAAFWTVRVLGSVMDADHAFRKHLFAVSGVSGGALGSAFLIAMLRRSDQMSSLSERFCKDNEERIVMRGDAHAFSRCGEAMAGGDFVAPPFVGLGYQDLLHWGTGFKFSTDDRAALIEESWEEQWHKIMDPPNASAGDVGLFARPFISYAPMAPPAPWYPAMLFNGTSVATGKRVITGNMALGPKATDTFDLFADLVPKDQAGAIRLSTAVTLAARFPYVLAAASVAGGRICKAKPVCDRVVDGGYFENFGATTAQDLLTAILDVSKPTSGSTGSWTFNDWPGRFYPVVIQIVSDPDIDPGAAVAQEAPEKTDSRMLSELSSPPEAFYNARSAHGILAMEMLQQMSRRAHFALVEFSLRGDGLNAGAVPLSWALSRAAQDAIHHRLCDGFNKPMLGALGSAVGASNLDRAVCR